MATNPIYVETEEEIPEVVERMRRMHGDDAMIVLPMRSRIGQSRFNFQLLRNYAARMGKRVTVVCDDPAVQKMASETGFPVFGAVGAHGEGIASEPEEPPAARRWWQRRVAAPVTHVGIVAPRKLLSVSATEIKPGRFFLYIAAATTLLVGLSGLMVFVPSATVTLVAEAQPFQQTSIQITAQPGSGSIKVRASTLSDSNSQGFKTTGVKATPAAVANGVVTYTNNCHKPVFQNSPGFTLPRGQRLLNSNSLYFAQTSPSVIVPWNGGTADVNVVAVQPGVAGNVGDSTITSVVYPDGNNDYPCLQVNNAQATGGGVDAASAPQMTESDFDAGRAVLEQELRQSIAQRLQAGLKSGEKLSETLVYSAPQYNTDHQPGDLVPNFSGTMTISGEGDYYIDSDVKKAFQQYLAQRVPTDQQLLTASPISVDYRILSAAKGGILTFLGNAQAFVAPRLDENAIRTRIVGKPLTSAKLYLQSLPIRSVTIKEQPVTLPLMPLLVGRISLLYVVQSDAVTNPTPSPQPTTSPNPSP
jgi:hypothetical protein